MSNEIDLILTEVCNLPSDWHGAGSVPNSVLIAIVKHTGQSKIHHSIETGSGRTTLLFSNISQDHKVFAVDAGNSVSNVRRHSLFNPETTEIIEGSSQSTLPLHVFKNKLQLALIDGPYAYPFPDMEYYFIYPHLEKGALLILDDINIPTINNMFKFMSYDDMFDLLEIVDNTAFFIRTDAPVFYPLGDGWEFQSFNKKNYPITNLTINNQRLKKLT